MSKKLILLVAGGSGGHFFPAAAVKEKFQDEYDFIFLIDERVSKIIDKKKVRYFEILPPKYSTSVPLFLKNILKIAYSCIRIVSLYFKLKPQLIIGFGGYTSVFPIIIGKIMNIKIIIHEQNAILGKANKLLKIFANKVAISFANTKSSPANSVFTGMPTRRKKNYSIKINKKVILIIGGSQGASFFSKLLLNTLSFFNKKELRQIYVICQCRNEDKLFVERKLSILGVKYEITDFFSNIYQKIFMSDLIISRSGSSTLAEISMYNKNSFLFPLRSAINNHQYLNAIQFQKENDCLIFDERKIDYQVFSSVLKKKIFLKYKSIKSTKKRDNRINFKNLIESVI